MRPRIVITGGAGYIGSHTAVVLAQAGYRPVIVDNFCNSSPRVLERLGTLCGGAVEFLQADLRDRAALDELFSNGPIEGVIHFAALKAVGESVQQPLRYFENNVGGTINLLQAMERAGLRQIVFSSSATVYGDPDRVPIAESAPLRVTSPYGGTKLVCEDLLRDLRKSDSRWRMAILRYFNPVGAHPSGQIGESPNGVPNNLMPYVAQVAAGKREYLQIFGDDYPTPDGTGVRDYVHVMDLARGHLAAMQYLRAGHGMLTVNLGTGRGVSVKQLIDTFSRVTGKAVPYRVVQRRPGDIATCYADTTLAQRLLGWHAEHDVERMCKDAWHWQSANPAGYGG